MDEFFSKFTLISKFILGLAIIGAVVYFIVVLVNQYKSKEEFADNALRVKEKTEENMTPDTSKMQDISFQQARLIDSAGSIFIIPVSQVDAQNDKKLVFTETSKPSEYPINGKRAFYRFSGSYNNLMIYTPVDTVRNFVFDKKININEFENELIGGNQYILMKATTEDSNKDGKLNSQDLTAFYLYDLQKDKLTEIAVAGEGLLDYQPITAANYILLRFVIDKNADGYIDTNKEPIIIKKLNVLNGEITDLVTETKIEELRSLINK